MDDCPVCDGWAHVADCPVCNGIDPDCAACELRQAATRVEWSGNLQVHYPVKEARLPGSGKPC